MIKTTSKRALKSGKILGVRVNSIQRDGLLTLLRQGYEGWDPLVIFTPNPEIVVEAQRNEKLREVLNKADVSLPDGVGLARALGYGVYKGREAFVDLLELANKKKLKVYLLGASEKVNKKSVEKIKEIYKGIKVYGSSGALYDDDGEVISKVDRKLHKDILNNINRIKPDILFVALGAPKQEMWVEKYIDSVDTKVVMVVGGSLDYFSGEKRLPPELFEKLGMEWMWRLLTDPKRIKRIFNAVIVFPLLLFFKRQTQKSS